jgi:hypothetical protein
VTYETLRTLAAAAATLCFAPAEASANIYAEMSFEAKMADSNVVILGTVTEISPSRPALFDGLARVRTVATLKGAARDEYLVHTQSRIAESDPRCCEIGVTYLMFLGQSQKDATFYSVNGRFGIIDVGGARYRPEIVAVPNLDLTPMRQKKRRPRR